MVILRAVKAALVVLLLLPGLVWAEARKSVLLVFDEDKDFPGLALVNRSLRETFRSEFKSDVEFYSESLNLSQFRDQDYDAVLRDLFRRKYATTSLDLIVAVLGPSLDFLLRHGEALFPGVPIVFCGVDPSDLEGRTLSKNVTGVIVRRAFGPTLEVALRRSTDSCKRSRGATSNRSSTVWPSHISPRCRCASYRRRWRACRRTASCSI